MMNIWATWLDGLAEGVYFFNGSLGLSEALAIVAFTFIVRILFLPLSLKAGMQSFKNRRALSALQPDLERLKQRYQNDPAVLAKQTMALYKEKGIRFLDRTTIANMGAQGLFGISMFQVLQTLGFKSAFLWITNLAKPDVALAVTVAVLTFFTMMLMPGTPEQSNLLMFFIPAFFSAFILISFPSALGLYWLTSNVVSLVQQMVLRYYFNNLDHQST